jgi:hypothetical protein
MSVESARPSPGSSSSSPEVSAPPRIPWRRFRHVAALAAVVVIVFMDALRPGRTLYERDLHLVVLAHTEVFVRCLAAGSWPVWNRALGFGEPLWAIPSAQVLYPPHWLNLIVQPWTYFTASAVFHLVLGGAGVYALLRRWNASAVGAWCGGAIWCTSGPLLSALTYWNHFSAFAWLSWAAVAADAAMERPSVGRMLAWGAAMAMPVVAGSPDAAIMAIAIVVAVVAARPWPSVVPIRHLAAGAAGAALFSIALGAAQWMPALELARRSTRADLSDRERTSWAVPPPLLAQVVLPIRPDRWALDREHRDRWFQGREPYLASLYLGLSALPLAVLGAATAPRRRIAALATLIVIAGMVSLGAHGGLPSFVTAMAAPLRALRYPAKAMVVVAFAWAVLVGAGVAGLEARPGLPRWRRRAVAISAVLAPAVAFGVSVALMRVHMPGVLDGVTDRSGMVRLDAIAVVGAALAATMIAFLLLVARRRSRATVLIALVPVLELAVLHRGLNPTAPVELLSLRPALADVIRRSPHGRVYVYDYLIWEDADRRHLGHEGLVLREAPVPWAGTLALRAYLYPHTLGAWGLESAYERDSHGLQPRETGALARLLRAVEGTPAHVRLLQLANVTHVVALHSGSFQDLPLLHMIDGPFQEAIRVYGVPDALPRTYVVAKARRARGDEALPAMVDPRFDARREVILSAAAEPAGPPPDGEPAVAESQTDVWRRAAAGASRIVEEAPDRVVIEADLTRAGYVVLSDAYDPGWRVRLDGRPAELLRANVGFRAVAAPAGHHRIEQVYRPSSVLLGGAITLVAGGVAAAAGLAGLRRGRGAAATASPPGGVA